jgi:hypothetical protein
MPLLDKIRDLTTAAKGLAKLALGGYDATQVTDGVYTARRAVCSACPKYKSITGQCGECGCFLAVKARLMFDPVAQERTGQKTKTSCPQGLWID